MEEKNTNFKEELDQFKIYISNHGNNNNNENEESIKEWFEKTISQQSNDEIELMISEFSEYGITEKELLETNGDLGNFIDLIRNKISEAQMLRSAQIIGEEDGFEEPKSLSVLTKRLKGLRVRSAQIRRSDMEEFERIKREIQFLLEYQREHFPDSIKQEEKAKPGASEGKSLTPKKPSKPKEENPEKKNNKVTVKMLKEQLEEAKKSIESKDETIKDLTAQIETLNREKEQTSEENKQAILKLNQQIETLTKKKDELSNELLQLKKNIETILQELKTLQEDLKNKEEKCTTLEGELKSTNKNLTETQTELEDVKQELSSAKNTSEQLRKNADTLKSTIDLYTRKNAIIKNTILNLLAKNPDGVSVSEIRENLKESPEIGEQIYQMTSSMDIIQKINSLRYTIPCIESKIENGKTKYYFSITSEHKLDKVFYNNTYFVPNVKDGYVNVVATADLHFPFSSDIQNFFKDSKKKLKLLYDFAEKNDAIVIPGGDLYGDLRTTINDFIKSRNNELVSNIYKRIEHLGLFMADHEIPTVTLLGNHGIHPYFIGIDPYQLLREASEEKCIILGDKKGTIQIGDSTIGLYHDDIFENRGYDLQNPELFMNLVIKDAIPFLSKQPNIYNIVEHFHKGFITDIATFIKPFSVYLFKYEVKDNEIKSVLIEEYEIQDFCKQLVSKGAPIYISLAPRGEELKQRKLVK